jgi:hypothetical protein
MTSGQRLTEIIATGPLATDRLLAVGTSLAELIEARHTAGDFVGVLTPASIYLTASGSILLLDAAHTPISARREDDLLALGELLYAMATGTSPQRHGAEPNNEARSPIEINPRLPSGLVPVIQRSIHSDASRRFAYAADNGAALREVRRAPGSLESLLPTEHVSSSAAVKPPPRPIDEERERQAALDAEHPDLPFGDPSTD